MSTIQQFLRDHAISEVEAIIPDMAGVARGKIMPAEKYAEDEGMRLPESIFLQTVTGEYPDDDSAIHPSEIDVVLTGDPRTIRVVPWAAEPTAQVIHDCTYDHGRPVPMAPRYVLRRVLELYAAHGWRSVVAPELEFFPTWRSSCAWSRATSGAAAATTSTPRRFRSSGTPTRAPPTGKRARRASRG